MSGVYEGLTVVELADRRNQWAGKLLSDGGARVIQIEPVNGSPGRWCGPFVNDRIDPDNCLDYWWNNTGKQSVALDVERKPAQDLLRQLLFADERRGPSRARRPDVEYGLLGCNRHAHWRTGPSGMAHGMCICAAWHHRCVVRPHDVWRGAIH